MEREFDYNNISIADVEANKHLTFVCDADAGKAIVTSENYEENF
jgi:hypothetical protein